MCVPPGQLIRHGVHPLVPFLWNRLQLSGSQPLLDMQPGLVHQLPQPVRRRKVVRLELIVRQLPVGHEGEQSDSTAAAHRAVQFGKQRKLIRSGAQDSE